MRHRGRRTALAVAVIAALAVTTAACERVQRPMFDRRHPSELALRYLTRDGDDTYVVTSAAGAARVDAPATNQATPEGADTRAVLVPLATPTTVDHQSCATWADTAGPWAQQGIALRASDDGDRFRTIVVAKNIVYGAEWQFNVDSWDTARDPYLVHHGVVQLRAPFEDGDVPTPLPWKICARVQGTEVTIRGWRAGDPVPRWDDPDHTGRVQLPADWTFAGRAGWYVGHIAPGGSIGFNNLRTSTWITVAGTPTTGR